VSAADDARAGGPFPGGLAVPIARIVGVALNPAIDRVASVPRLVPGSIHRPAMLSTVPGGKAVNVVRAASRLGLPGSVVAGIGGHTGAWFREALASEGIGLHAVKVAGEMRTCLSVLDQSTGALTELYEDGARLDAGAWVGIEAALAEALTTRPAEAVVVLSGSVPPGAPDDAYARLARLAADRGARVVVDTGGTALGMALEARPWLVKVNATEAQSVTGSSARTLHRAAAAAGTLRGLGAVNAIVTRGVHGAVLATREGAWALAGLPPAHRGPYAVGSGDSFLAGLLAGIARGEPAADALRLAGAAGAANARVPGQGDLDAAEVGRSFRACRVTALPPA
jgi:1-phosphofructokinase family hexose kinase